MNDVTFEIIENQGNYKLRLDWWEKPLEVYLTQKTEGLIKANEILTKERIKVEKLTEAFNNLLKKHK